ncbi:MAG: glycosyltransferase [Actinobacteria bacterium]|uniref:Unannotated protein n=1 Tax=freshwater metagenome TaxID=449393 RepID=A0A6J5ZVB7_9ZZZZ|nr:glycosyltransferase [Actinomycetota bacterium]
MRVAIDARHIGRGRGIARYLEEMLASLAAQFPGDEWVAVVPGRSQPALPPGVELRRPRLPSRPTFAAAALCGRPRLAKIAGGADVCWVPAPAPVACGAAFVLTLHDRSFEANPDYFTAYERLWHLLARPRQLAEQASELVVISEATLKDLQQHHWPIDPNHCTVIGAAPSAAVASPNPTMQGTRGDYLLFVGALEPRKGVDTLAAACIEARANGLDNEILIVGEGRLEGQLAAIPGLRIVGRQTDSELATLYAGALALLVPSRSEGFGSPAIEAACHGVPAVVSDLAVFDETLGAGALRFETGNADSLAAAMATICEDAELRGRLGSLARERAAMFSWDAAARELHAVLTRAAGEA